MARFLPRLAPLALAAALVALAGCEDTVDPTLGTQQVFSIYGFLDPTADRQALRVVPIAETIGADTTLVIDASMTSVEPATGRTAAWRDSVVTFADGSVGHIFVSDYTPTPGTRVEVSIAASDGRVAMVAVETPPLARPAVGAPFPGLGLTTYPVSIAGVPRVLGGTLRLYVTGKPGAPGVSTIDVPLERLEITEEAGKWTVNVPFLEATAMRMRDLGLFNTSVVLLEAEFSPFVANEEWAVPPGGFDLNQIIEPGTFSNVNGGFGFVGSGYRAPVRWVPSTNVQSRAGFEVTNDPAALIAINEIGTGYVEFFNPTPEAIDLSGYLLVDARPGRGERTIPGGSLISSGAFLVVNGPFDAVSGALLQLLTASRRLLKSIPTSEGFDTWGAYPDGYSFQLTPLPAPNLFYGPVRRSPGAPNEPASTPVIINEISTSGDGYVEVLTQAYDGENAVLVGTSGDALANSPTIARGSATTGSGSFLLAREGGNLTLDQLGGAVFVMVNFQVVDARFYGPQTPETSAGYLPDGPGGTWTNGLRPTPSAANAFARLGL